MEVLDIVKKVNIKADNKQTWLDNIPNKDIIEFAKFNIEIETKSALNFERFYKGNTQQTSKLNLLEKDNIVYEFFPYFITTAEEFGNPTELNELTKAWILFVGQHNEDVIINGKNYYDSAIEEISKIFDIEDEEVETFITSLELVNIL